MVAACVGCSLYLPSVRNFCKDLAHRITLMLLCFLKKTWNTYTHVEDYKRTI